MNARYHFHGDLRQLLRRRWRTADPIVQPVSRIASIKDVIESFGVPHAEVGDITCDGHPVDFCEPVQGGRRFDIHPHSSPRDVTRPTRLYPLPLPEPRFIVDITAGRLARYLRMAGIDTLYHPSPDTATLLTKLQSEPRVLLTRSLELLKRKEVVFGYVIRAETPLAQLGEIIGAFGIRSLPGALTRCLHCNAPLAAVAKHDILPRLQPLTIRYYELFSICRRCDRIYWEGSHVFRMRKILTAAGDLPDSPPHP